MREGEERGVRGEGGKGKYEIRRDKGGGEGR